MRRQEKKKKGAHVSTEVGVTSMTLSISTAGQGSMQYAKLWITSYIL